MEKLILNPLGGDNIGFSFCIINVFSNMYNIFIIFEDKNKD